MLRATLPAPPMSFSSRVTAITGAGASGRDPRDLAIDEVVEHQVSDAKDRLLGYLPQCVLEREHALSVPIPKFAIPCSILLRELRNRKDASKFTIPLSI